MLDKEACCDGLSVGLREGADREEDGSVYQLKVGATCAGRQCGRAAVVLVNLRATENRHWTGRCVQCVRRCVQTRRVAIKNPTHRMRWVGRRCPREDSNLHVLADT